MVDCGWDVDDWLKRLTVNAEVAAVLSRNLFLSPGMGRGIDSRNRVWNWVAKLLRLAGRYRYDNLMRMRSSLVRMRSSLVRMRSSLVRMKSSLVVRTFDCQCTSCNGPGFDPSIRRHSWIWGAADEAVLNIVRKKYIKKSPQKIF